MLESTVHVVSKVETYHDAGNQYWVYGVYTFETPSTPEKEMQFRTPVERELWDRLEVGDTIWLKETTVVKNDGMEMENE